MKTRLKLYIALVFLLLISHPDLHADAVLAWSEQEYIPFGSREMPNPFMDETRLGEPFSGQYIPPSFDPSEVEQGGTTGIGILETPATDALGYVCLLIISYIFYKLKKTTSTRSGKHRNVKYIL